MRNLNNRGMTAVELMIGIGLVAMLTTIVVGTQVDLARDQMKLKGKLEDSIDTNLAERMMFTDFNGVDPSYNNLTLVDDNNQLFFDYYPDLPAGAVPNRVDRSIELGLDKKRKDLMILVHDAKAGPVINYDPVAAYDVGAAPADFNQAATLTFKGLNRNKWVTNLYQASNSALWNKGRLLMLDTPARLRPLDSDGKVNMKVAPRSPLFVGMIDGDALVTDDLIRSAVNLKHPQIDGLSINSADEFLRRVPSVGGGQAIVRLRPVRIIRYYLEPQKDDTLKGKPAYLYKQSYDDGKWSAPLLMADKISSVQLRRDSVLKRMIYFKINKADKKEGTQTAGL